MLHGKAIMIFDRPKAFGKSIRFELRIEMMIKFVIGYCCPKDFILAEPKLLYIVHYSHIVVVRELNSI